MQMRSVVGTVAALIGLSVLAAAVLLSGRSAFPDPATTPVVSNSTIVVVAESRERVAASPGPIGQVPFADVLDAGEADSADVPDSSATSRPAPPAGEPFLQGITGVVTSPRVARTPEASGGKRFGLDPRRAEAYVLPMTFGPAMTVYGAPETRRRPGRDGAFRLPTTPGLKLVVLRQDDAEPGLVEIWSAVVRVSPEETLDLGVDAFSVAVTRGRVVDEAGRPVARAMIFADDREPDDHRPIVLGTDAMTLAGKDGAFAFSFARYTGPRAAFPCGPVLRLGVSAGDGDRRAESEDVPVGGRCELVLKPIARTAPPSRSRRLSIAAPAATVLYVRSDRLVDVHELDASSAGSDGRLAFELDLPAEDYVFEFVDGDRVAVVAATFRAESELRLDPVFEIGRAVEGTAEGAVSRVVFPGEPRERALQTVRADGPFVLSGLPPTGELALRVAGRLVRIPDGSPRVVRLD